MSSIYRCYRPKTLLNKPFKRSLRESNYFTPAQRIILSTDKNGLVALRPLTGTAEGTIRIQAQALKLETGNVNTPADLTGNATYLIQAKTAADGPASFTGQVFDDKSKPLAGIKVSIGRTALVSTTDEAGKFELNNIPPGRIDLFIDGRTYNPTLDTTRAQYPSLHFEAYAVKGRVNQIAHPIYLPPLATSADSAKQVGGNQDVILTIPGLQGFAMKVKANSVTFPDGSKTGLLIVSPVTADKLPMSPPAGGAQFGVPAWTLQPAGTRFDPPIEVTLPNTRAYPAGDNIPVVQWDHDLGQYVAMGRATVSEDGAVLITDSGSGLTKAGWGGACVYDPDKCAAAKQPTITKLEIKMIGNGDSNFGGRAGDIWVGQNEPLAFVSDDAAQSCSRDYTWNFGDGGTSKARNPFYSFPNAGQFNVTLGLKCTGDDCVNATEKSTNRTVNVCEGTNANIVNPVFVEVPPIRVRQSAFSGSGGDRGFGKAGYEKITVTEISASCENGDWFPVVKGMRGEFSKFVNTNRPNTQNIISASEADSIWFCAQVQGLRNEYTPAKYTGPDWVNCTAVEIHGQFHLNGIRSRFNSNFVSSYNSYLKSNLRLPISQFSKEAALERFRQSGLLSDSGAEEQFKIVDAIIGNSEDGINRKGPAYQAEFAVTAPLVDAICRRANSLGWNAGNTCSICAGK